MFINKTWPIVQEKIVCSANLSKYIDLWEHLSYSTTVYIYIRIVFNIFSVYASVDQQNIENNPYNLIS